MNILDDLKTQYRLGGIDNRIIYWNVGFFLISYVFPGILRLLDVNVDFLQFVSLSSNPADFLWKPWSIISYSFFILTSFIYYLI